ncbi:ImmA/IrrE family metallo-endopeptidase [Phenylobacterium aquaticum]|uniref:ImmA/IrrE family metallo-endopeptidase n=1 Tax=Phenylobacterium aquaticum TaxID=1763816 RepID=UPI001F5C3DD8|nr:ImmA/IrrE family metallo-endopeptidase [Phenylobacterium aquaticum]MCI3132883.1 ImmA/IrrE family metallo-endopeptidase [Phenylobacterium aquaticum]
MPRPDDSSLTPGQWARVRKEAERALREAGALGVFPTPVAQIMAVAKVEEVKEDVLNPSFIAKLRSKAEAAGQAVKRALTKVIGLFHASAGLVYISKTLIEVKKRFVRLHEAGHGFMAWQRPMYTLVEDCEKALDASTAELFDREANVFASEVLFQLDTFRDMAESEAFEIWTPVNLARRFNASNYAAIRQYVSKSPRTCAVVVLNMPELVEGDGFRAELRRAIQSDGFTALFGAYDWKASYTPDDKLGRLIPVGKRKSSGKRSIGLRDLNGEQHDCVAESFSTGHNVFILIHAVKTLSARRFYLPAA